MTMIKVLIICFVFSSQYLETLASTDDYEQWLKGFEERNVVLLSRLIIKLKHIDPTAEEYIEKLGPFEKQLDKKSFEDIKSQESEFLEVCEDMKDWINYSTEDCNYQNGEVECCIPEGYTQPSTTAEDDLAKRAAFIKELIGQKKEELSKETKDLFYKANEDMKPFMKLVAETSDPSIKDLKELESKFETICQKYKDYIDLRFERCFSSQGFANCCIPEYGRLYNALGSGTRREAAATYGKFRPGPDYEYFVATKFD